MSPTLTRLSLVAASLSVLACGQVETTPASQAQPDPAAAQAAASTPAADGVAVTITYCIP